MPQDPTKKITDQPLWWFVMLAEAMERCDIRAATIAVRGLDRLGIEVRFHPARITRPRKIVEAVVVNDAEDEVGEPPRHDAPPSKPSSASTAYPAEQ